MALSRDDLELLVDTARDYLQRSRAEGRADVMKFSFAEALVQLSGSCVVGLPCEKHGGVVHGQEAEELRAGVEQILGNTTDVRDDDAAFVLAEQRMAFVFLLDRIDARDSLAFREGTDQRGDAGA